MILDWAGDKGHELRATHVYRGESLPPVDGFDLLVVMGGPMNAYEEERHPWLKPEKAFLRAVIDAGRQVVGICLGAQLISAVLGGEVTRNRHREIGWFPVRFGSECSASRLFRKIPERLEVLHWHGDTFSIPEGAIVLAESDACENQGFEFDGRVVALQFHAECREQEVEALIATDLATSDAEPFVQTAAEIRAGTSKHTAAAKVFLFGLLDRMESAGAQADGV